MPFVEVDSVFVLLRSVTLSDLQIRAADSRDKEWIERFITDRWGAEFIVAHRAVYYCKDLPGFIALQAEEQVGLVTYTISGSDCEIVSLDSLRPCAGIGTALIDAVKAVAVESGCTRLWLVTTNDNMNALRFYQKRGFVLVKVNRNAIEFARRLKSIPLIGHDAIPLRDELELEMILNTSTMHVSKNNEIFNRCPHCGASEMCFDGIKKLYCRACSFTFFHNAAAAVAAVLEYGEQIVLIKRSKEPGKGKLDLPGGFVDPDEGAEEAVRREVKEELGIDLGALTYLGSYPNTYEYKDVTYKTCDLFFSSRIDALPTVFDKTEIEELVLAQPSEVSIEKIAFESSKIFLSQYSRDF